MAAVDGLMRIAAREEGTMKRWITAVLAAAVLGISLPAAVRADKNAAVPAAKADSTADKAEREALKKAALEFRKSQKEAMKAFRQEMKSEHKKYREQAKKKREAFQAQRKESRQAFLKEHPKAGRFLNKRGNKKQNARRPKHGESQGEPSDD
ncbi:MAG: hypothetical protein AUJ52_10280 [Elusimicrobia bacterium CG1_02_63_36]|nr:MAG: hypothetical protein AUJ52_10280 [Elusimicrobia bacterium CG1_02_63_36]PIP83897.1 MAG: hypothetical protein COR54_07040 [Elusimicrobia bacterium CG22_combo_CG10-13_8_21_14_all_63_91]PJA11478.1 MAG: hypothetical protein COX66_19795 [Elusimicrobia bacterium CG_4_10_14_0_2_um_filter_63_34]PJB25661.1 MAG: hypothetical protein CO113_07475 [Elusimicrobia bacterium CG_4_9_14_3_um_filter_62_55]